MDNHSCGSCFACCVWLGIKPLKKWPGQTCKHLDGAHGPETRCSIYPDRPQCCADYLCGWRHGFGGDDMRPDRSGVLVTFHPNEGESEDPFIATIHVIDKTKAGAAADPDSLLNAWVAMILSIGCNDIRIIQGGDRPGSRIIHFSHGKILTGTVLKPDHHGFEDLNFAEEEEPLGHYRIKKSDELTAEDQLHIDALRHAVRQTK